MIALLPCPFCGCKDAHAGERVDWATGEAYSVTHRYPFIQCGKEGFHAYTCGAVVYGASADDATMRWNARVYPAPAVSNEVERLRRDIAAYEFTNTMSALMEPPK